MKFMIMGAGALGCYFGGRLQAAGHDVTFVARGAHLAAMQANGLQIESLAGDLTLPEVRAVGHPSDAPTPDVVLFLVKNFDVESSAEALLPSLGGETFLVTGQNGVAAPDRLGAVVGAGRVVPGAVRMTADIKAPGVVRHSSPIHEIFIGEADGTRSERVDVLAEVLNNAGTSCFQPDDIRTTLWGKFVMLSAFSALTTLTRLNIGPVRETPEALALLEAAIDETAAVARAVNPGIEEDLAAAAKAFLLEIAPPDVHASMLDDLNQGKRIELDYLSGDVVRLGAKAGVPTPVHSFVTAALMPYLNGTPG